MINSRREFLVLSAKSLAALTALCSANLAFTAPAKALPPGKRYLLVNEGLKTVDPTKHYERPMPPDHDESGSILAIDPATGEAISIDIGFFGHIVTPNHERPYQVVSLHKWGKQGVLVDLKSHEVLVRTEASDNNMFFGHTAFSTDGSHMVTSEDNFDGSPMGFLVLRDAMTMQVVQKMPSYGFRPHECRTPDKGKTIIVVNEGTALKEPNLTWIDFQSGRRLRHVPLGELGRVRYTHVAMSEDNWVVILGMGVANGQQDTDPVASRSTFYRRQLITFISPEGDVIKPELPKDIWDRVIGEALSVSFIKGTSLAAINLPQTGLLLIMDYKKQIVVEAIPLDSPQGVVSCMHENEDDFKVLVSLEHAKILSMTGKPDAPKMPPDSAKVLFDKGRTYCSHMTSVSI